MSVYEVYNPSIMCPILQKVFQYSLEGEYLAPSSNGDHATIPLGHDILTTVLPKDTLPPRKLIGIFIFHL